MEMTVIRCRKCKGQSVPGSETEGDFRLFFDYHNAYCNAGYEEGSW